MTPLRRLLATSRAVGLVDVDGEGRVVEVNMVKTDEARWELEEG